MAKVHDNISEGRCCQVCGEVFPEILAGKEPAGYPQTCDNCEEDE